MGSAHTGRFDYLDGIRALAIGAVLSLHWLSWYSPFLHGGSDRGRRLLRPQRLHHHHDAVAFAWSGHPGRRLVGVREAPRGAALPGAARARHRRVRALRRHPVGTPGSVRGRSAWSLLAHPGICGLGSRPERQLLAPGAAPVRADVVTGHRVVLLPALAPCRAGRQGSGVHPRTGGRGQPAGGGTALPRRAPVERLLVLLRTVGALRRAARRGLARAVVPGRGCAPRPVHSDARSRLGRRGRHRRHHRVRPGRAQPALPLRRGAGHRAGHRGAHLHRLQPDPRPGAPAAQPPVAGRHRAVQLQPLPVAHRSDAAPGEGRSRPAEPCWACSPLQPRSC